MGAKLKICIMFTWVSAACATAPEPEKKGPPEPVFYTLRTAEPIKHTRPLPNQISIFVDWKMSDGSTVAKEGFRGWDIDHDGKFDVLEVLAADGTTTSWAYDFDGDGKIDAVQQTASTMSPLALGSPMEPVHFGGETSESLQLSH